MPAPPPTPAIPQALVVGAGPAGLMAAERLLLGGVAVTAVERMATPGRRLLMAGVGGLNLTHDDPSEAFLARYGAAAPLVAPTLDGFGPRALREWCAALGQDTFVGSSRRVFPRAMKAAPLLRAWLTRLSAQGLRLLPRHRWLGWDAAGLPRVEPPPGVPWPSLAPAVTVLAAGGASWPRLGSDGSWAAALPAGTVSPLRPANCGFLVPWSDHLRDRFAGTPLKRIAVGFAGRRVPGEAVLTARGIEGGPFYALGAALRDAIEARGEAVVALDLRPDLSEAALAERLARPRGSLSLSGFLRRHVGLPPVAVALLREVGATPDAIKSLPLRLVGTDGLERAISTAGGLRLPLLRDWRLCHPGVPSGVFAAGEMLDWEAPTGGFLLQGAFSTGFAAGEAALAWLKAGRGGEPCPAGEEAADDS